jgi:hypothetical protein
MKTKNLFVAGLFFASAFMARQSSAQFELMDNLTTQPAGNLAGLTAADGGTWTGLGTAGTVTIGPSVTTGNAAVTSAADGADYLPLYAPIGVGNTATVFFQFDMGSSITANNVNWSVENIGTATDAGGTSANDVTELNANAPNRSGITIRNNGSFVQMYSGGVNFVPAVNTEYEAWMVVNNSAQTYQVYLAGGSLGAFGSPTPMNLGSATGSTTGTMRNAQTGGSAIAINDFIFGTGGTGDTTTQGLYDVYEDPNGLDLTDPTAVSAVPEPGTLSLLGLGGSALLLQLRRIRAKARL